MRVLSGAEKKRILIVEDEKDIQELLAFNLSTEKTSVEVASSGNEALELLEKQKFDLILSDIKMQNGSGIELLAELGRRGGLPPFVFLTAYPDIDEKKLLEMGAVKIFYKPAKFIDIYKFIEKALGLAD